MAVRTTTVPMSSILTIFIVFCTACSHSGFYLEDVPLNVPISKALKIVRDKPRSIVNRNGDTIYSWDSGFLVSSKNRVVSVIPHESPRLISEVESFCEAIPSARKAIVISGMAGTTNEDIQFITYKRYFESILKNSGYLVTENPSEATVAVLIKYGVSDPHTETRVFSTPVYDFIPSSSQTTTISNKFGREIGTATTNSPASLQYAGERIQTTHATTYRRYISMTAIDLKRFMESQKMTPLWKVTTSNQGSSNDLTSMLPYLLLSSQYFIEKDSHGMAKDLKGFDDTRILKLRNDVSSQKAPASTIEDEFEKF